MPRAARFAFIALLAFSIAPFASAEGKKKIVLMAGTPSHEFGGHEHNAGVLLLARCLQESPLGSQLEIVVLNSHKAPNGKTMSGWPEDPKVLDGAAAIVVYCDGGNNHMLI